MTTWLWVSLACNLALLVSCLVALKWGESCRVAQNKAQKRVRSLEEPDPLCGCGHHISFHDQETGCHFTVVIHHSGRMGPRSTLTTCQCVHYVGPEPLPRVIAMPIRKKEEE